MAGGCGADDDVADGDRRGAILEPFGEELESIKALHACARDGLRLGFAAIFSLPSGAENSRRAAIASDSVGADREADLRGLNPGYSAVGSVDKANQEVGSW